MSRRNQYEINFARILSLLEIGAADVAQLEVEQTFRLSSSGYMDLVVEVLYPCPETHTVVISLTHYFKQNGDLCSDPDMEIRLYPPGCTEALDRFPSTRDGEHGRAEAMTFEMSASGIYQRVYDDPSSTLWRPGLSRSLNSFLSTWLRNLEQQGHRLQRPPESPPPVPAAEPANSQLSLF